MLFEFFTNLYTMVMNYKSFQSLVIKQNQQLEALMLDLTVLLAEVTENNDAIASAVTLITTLVEELRAAAGNQAEIDAIVNALDAQTAALAAAVAANTPADPVVIEEVPAE